MEPLFEPGVYDPVAAAQAKEYSMQQVKEHADMDWRIEASKIVRHLARTREKFTTDAVWYLLEQFTDVSTHEPRAMGPIMLAAAKHGMIQATDQTVKSVRAVNHQRPIQVWRSLIYNEAEHLGVRT